MGYLPGDVMEPKPGFFCENHDDRPSYKVVIGETDSFGSEWTHMCEECYQEYLVILETRDTSGECDWCHKHSDSLRFKRDTD